MAEEQDWEVGRKGSSGDREYCDRGRRKTIMEEEKGRRGEVSKKRNRMKKRGKNNIRGMVVDIEKVCVCMCVCVCVCVCEREKERERECVMWESR